MTTKARRKFTDEFKSEAVARLKGGGRPVTQVAMELGIQPSMLTQLAGEGTWRCGTARELARDRSGS